MVRGLWPVETVFRTEVIGFLKSAVREIDGIVDDIKIAAFRGKRHTDFPETQCVLGRVMQLIMINGRGKLHTINIGQAQV